MSKNVLTQEIIYEIKERLYQIHALGNIFDLCEEEELEIGDKVVGSGFSQFGQIVKKLAAENLDIMKNIKEV